ncbi:MAG: sensor histidine kinase [Dehalococcoidia bacterium]
MGNLGLMQTGVRIAGLLVALAGVVNLILAPFIGGSVFAALWGVEPLAYIGAILVMVGVGVISLSYFIPQAISRKSTQNSINGATAQRWGEVTQQYFELFDHDLARPLRQILGKERELSAVLRASGAEIDPPIRELLDEIERQVPNFRLMISNIQVLVQLEAPKAPPRLQAVEPSEVVRRIVDRYATVAAESHKEITWWAEPAEFGIVYSDSSAIEHIVANLVANAVRFATTHIEIKLTKNPSHFFIRVWDDGPGIPPQYTQHIFDRGWTPEVARREEKSSSGLGLFIAQTLANQYGGDLTVESIEIPDPNHHTAFLLSLPLYEPE